MFGHGVSARTGSCVGKGREGCGHGVGARTGSCAGIELGGYVGAALARGCGLDLALGKEVEGCLGTELARGLSLAEGKMCTCSLLLKLL